jgi:hypothetical protein
MTGAFAPFSFLVCYIFDNSLKPQCLRKEMLVTQLIFTFWASGMPVLLACHWVTASLPLNEVKFC